MKLESVQLAIPSRRVSNDDIIALVKAHSDKSFEGDLDKALNKVGVLLERSGARSRNWLSQDERPLDITVQVVERALREARFAKKDIELLIYTSVDRGFVEPANAYFIAHALGMNRVHCFDILDACNGWSRALHLAYTLLQTGVYSNVLLVSSEFSMFEEGPIYPGLFSLRTLDEIEWKFPGYTLGEGATATVLSHEPEREWEFHFSSRPDLAPLCTLPLRGFERYCLPSEYIGLNGSAHFTSFGSQLYREGAQELIKLIQRLTIPLTDVRAIFTHASSKKGWHEGAEILGVQAITHNVFPDYGNLISASVPAAMALAIQNKQIRRGDRVVGCVGSAGMSFSVYSFIY